MQWNPLGKGGCTASIRGARLHDRRLGRIHKLLEFLAKLMAFFSQPQSLVIVHSTKFEVAATVVLSEFEFHDLPCVIQLISPV